MRWIERNDFNKNVISIKYTLSKLKFILPIKLNIIVITNKGISLIFLDMISLNSFERSIIASGIIGIKTLAFIYIPPFRIYINIGKNPSMMKVMLKNLYSFCFDNRPFAIARINELVNPSE